MNQVPLCMFGRFLIVVFLYQELVSSNPNQRNWRGILIALLVIVIVLALIVTSVVLLTPPDDGPRVKGQRFKLGDILGHEFTPLRFNGSWVSERSVLVNNGHLMLFRHSYLAQYSIYDIATMDTFPLTPTPDKEGHPFLLHADWAPRGHSLVMVYNYDIYYLLSPRGGQSYRVTNTAVPGIVSNGVTDWLYEEEILGSNQALWMSDDGHLMLYATFNDTLVEEQRFPWFGVQEEGKLYPEIRSHGWVDAEEAPLFSSDGNNYITIAPVRDGPAGFFKHVVSVNIPKKRVLPLTHGKFEVAKILAWDHTENLVYYLGIPEGRPGQLHLFRTSTVTPKVGVPLSSPQCLTCQPEQPNQHSYSAYYAAMASGRSGTPNGAESAEEWDEDDDATPAPTQPPPRKKRKQKTRWDVMDVLIRPCQYHNVVFSPGLNYYVLECLGPGVPTVQYGGPGSQIVTERWKLDWSTYLAGNRDFIIAQIDGRGSGGQGYQMLHEVYMRLGTVEVADQLEVTEYLRDSLHFVDKRRVAVWGWSYGGYMAAMALAREQEVFHCGISVAPVTTWRLYAYTERYMGLPNVTGNYKGYEEADVNLRVERLRDKMFYLVHGTADDNVHFQQSMTLAKNLANKGVLFRQQVYPDESHSLNGVMRHLYRSMANFLDDCFRKQVPPDLKAGLRNGGTSGE
ncbi:hypothetical protein C0J52_15483 [Blattella germanica]|nr:hypothetical protein C0J52_15483 [Blattella germanica]